MIIASPGPSKKCYIVCATQGRCEKDGAPFLPPSPPQKIINVSPHPHICQMKNDFVFNGHISG